MPDGTVRGAFDLDTAGAIRGLRGVRDAGREADTTLKALGNRMDSLATTSTRVMGQVSSSWSAIRRSIEDQSTRIEARIDRLEGRLDRFGTKTWTPKIELNGFDRVNAQLTELEARLDRLGARDARARVSLGGGFGGGGQGMVAGGGGSPMFSSIGGLAGRLPWWLMGAPLLPQIAGAGVGLLGSAGSAALGAGAVGTAAVGSLATGAGLSMLVAKPAITALGNITKAQTAYNDAVQAFGRNSTRAVSAKHALDLALVSSPAGAAGAARQVSLLRSDFQSATRPGTSAIYGGIAGAAYNLRSGIRGGIGADANMAASATAGGAVQLSRYLTDPAALSQYRQLTQSFAMEMPTVVSTAGNLVRIFGNLAVAAIPFFHEADHWVNSWTTGVRTSTGDTQRMRAEMDKMVTSAKDWGRMLGAGGHVLKDLLGAGRPAGDSMVVEFTHTLDRWDTWLRDNPGKLQTFMQQGEQGISRIATVIGNISGDVWTIFKGLDPILTRAEQFLSFASGLGGGSLLTGGGLLFGAYEGARRSLGGGGPSAGALTRSFVFGGAPMLGGAGSRMAGGTLVGAAPGAARSSYLLAPAGFQAGGTAATVGDQLPLFAAGAAGYAYRGGGVSVAARGERAFQQAFGGIEGARYAMPELVAARGPGLLARGGGALAGAARGAAPIVLGLAAIQGLIAATNTRGGVPHAIGTGLSTAASSLTLGLVSPTSISHFLHMGLGTDLAGTSLAGKAPEMQAIAARASAVRSPQDLARFQASIRFTPSRFEMSPGDRTKFQAFLQSATATAVRNAGSFASNRWESAFTTGLASGQAPTRAVGTMLSGMTRQMAELGPSGAKAFAGDTAAWVAQLQQDNPQMRGPLQKLMNGIVGDLNKLDHHAGTTMKDLRDKVFFFNGQILTGTQSTWKQIGQALTDPAQVAQEKLLGIFDQIQSEAINALTGMGFTTSQAQGIVRGTQQLAQHGIAGATGSFNQVLNPTSPPAAPRKGHARGGMIGGSGLLDTVALPGGAGTAAPGEAWIANRHTMMDLSSATLAKYGKTAWEMIRDETRPHSAPMMATGGFMSTPGRAKTATSSGWVLRAHPELHPGIAAAVEAVLGRYPLSITSTTRGGHAGQSYHYLGEAADISGSSGDMLAAAAWISRSGLSRSLTEGIHNPNLSVKYGAAVPSSYWGAPTWAEHVNHIHMAVAGALGAYGSGAGAFGGGAVSLRAPSVGLRGIPGAMATRAGQMYAAGLSQKINSSMGGSSFAGMVAPGGGGSMSANQTLGRAMMLSYWAGNQWPYLDALWTRESGWNAGARNPSSGAAGIPQDITGNMHGGARGQIAWGLNYIQGRYGSPSAAWAHEQAHGWYARGGRASWAGWHERGGSFITNGPTVFGAGEKGKREHVTISPAGAHGSGHTIIVKMDNVHLSAQPQEIDSIGREVAAKILEALDRATHGGSDAELMQGATA